MRVGRLVAMDQFLTEVLGEEWRRNHRPIIDHRVYGMRIVPAHVGGMVWPVKKSVMTASHFKRPFIGI